MKILFVRPNMHPGRSRDAMEPLVFAVLRGLTPPEVETVLYDERLEPVPTDERADLVAMTVETYTARRAYQLARAFRQNGTPVVMGGYHPTLLPEETLLHADCIVRGDAEGAWEILLDDFRRDGCPSRRIYEASTSGSLAGHQPDRSIFRGKSYAPISLVQFGRGCRYNCDFCSIRAFYGARLRQRTVADVVADIRAAGRSHVFLVDDNIFVDTEKAKELFRALIPLKISWSCQVSIDIARDPELVDLLRRSGCATAVVGFESLHPANLRQMKKSWNLKSGGYSKSIRILQDAGIMIYGTFVFGYDGDTAASFEPTVEFALEHKFYLANFNPLTPTPAAPLMERLRKENRLLHERWWLDPQFRYGDATFTPLGMSPDELTQGCYQARTRFNTLSSIVSRFWDPRTHLRSPKRIGIYLASNFITRREIHDKQGRPLGDPDPSQDFAFPVSLAPLDSPTP